MIDKPNIALRMVVYLEGGGWIAHCLEMDVVAEGKTANEAMRNLEDLCQFQIEVAMKEGDLDSVFRPAPPYRDLDALAGTWSDEEAEEFLSAIADFERVDEGLQVGMSLSELEG